MPQVTSQVQMRAAVDQVLDELDSQLGEFDGEQSIYLRVRHFLEDVPHPVDEVFTRLDGLLRNDHLVRYEAAQLPMVVSRILAMLLNESHCFGQRIDRDIIECGPQPEPVVGMPVR